LQHAACNGSWDDLGRFYSAPALSNFASVEFLNVVVGVLMVLVEHSHSLAEARVACLGKRNRECVGRVTDVLDGLVRQRNSRFQHLAAVLGERESYEKHFGARERAIGQRPVFLVETSYWNVTRTISESAIN
jgi:hypothetical protein